MVCSLGAIPHMFVRSIKFYINVTLCFSIGSKYRYTYRNIMLMNICWMVPGCLPKFYRISYFIYSRLVDILICEIIKSIVYFKKIPETIWIIQHKLCEL